VQVAEETVEAARHHFVTESIDGLSRDNLAEGVELVCGVRTIVHDG
jgi:hypothetical protein